MTIEQTITIPVDRRVFFEFLAPGEIPPGQAKIKLTVNPAAENSANTDPSPISTDTWEALAMEQFARY